jgi:branched-chain amino acid transport system substrate-binding protein
MQLGRRSVSALAFSAFAGRARAQGARAPIKVGLILPMTGPFQSTGRQVEAAVRLCIQERNGTVAGQPFEVVLKDDGGVADTTRRLAQELVVNDKVRFLAGFGLTPLALAAAPIATRGKVPEIVMAAATAAITEQSPFIVRTSVTIPQTTTVLADWAARNGVRKVATLVTDYGPGIDAETWFKNRFTEAGGQIAETLRVPLQNPDFAPFLQRARYAAPHDSPENRRFVEGFKRLTNGGRPNFMAVGGYDGATLMMKAVEAAGAGADGAALVEAMKGMSWESPRGPVSIDRETREMTQNIYIRRVERVNGELHNVEIDTFAAVRDPAKARKG